MADPPDPAPAPPPLRQIVEEVGLYPVEAFEFVQLGLGLTVQRLHAEQTDPDASRHISGRELCLGLRDVAHERWGYLAGAVLKKWNITRTLDFGKIVFAMVEHGLLSKTDEDSIEDFRQVFDFQETFERDYRIASETP